MGKNSVIEWTDHTANLWWGCHKVHTGCKNCYAEELSDNRYQNDLWGDNKNRKLIKSTFQNLSNWQKQAKKEGALKKVFCGSMMDIFEETKPLTNPTDSFRNTNDLRQFLFELIDKGSFKNLIFLFLTKRPENIIKFIPSQWLVPDTKPFNVWFGTSISDQSTSNKHVAAITKYLRGNLFLSIEPQVGEITELDLTHIDWVIQGGESGKNRRPFDLKWAEQVNLICDTYGVPHFFKQVDKVRPVPEWLMFREFPNFNEVLV